MSSGTLPNLQLKMLIIKGWTFDSKRTTPAATIAFDFVINHSCGIFQKLEVLQKNILKKLEFNPKYGPKKLELFIFQLDFKCRSNVKETFFPRCYTAIAHLAHIL